MDCKELVEHLKSPTWQDLEDPDSSLLPDAATAITDLLARLEWVSVEQQMPEEGRPVLVWCRSRMSTRHATVSTFYDGKWSRRVRDVTHWMPLPEPPKEESL